MSVLHVLEVEALVGLVMFGVAYGLISLVLWHLNRESERRQRARDARGGSAPTGKS